MVEITLSELINKLIQYLTEKAVNSKGTAFSFMCPEFIQYLAKQYNNQKKFTFQSICPLVHRLMEMTENVTIYKRKRCYIYLVQKKKLGKIIEILQSIRK